MTRKLLLAATSVFLVVAAAELGTRVTGLGELTTYRPDPRWGYLMQPGQRVAPYGSLVEINSLGLRGPELRDPKPPGVTRVLFLGDSITYASGWLPRQGCSSGGSRRSRPSTGSRSSR